MNTVLKNVVGRLLSPTTHLWLDVNLFEWQGVFKVHELTNIC